MLQMLNLPDWLPWWVPLVLLVPTLLWALSFLFMPFSVFGVKSRLEAIEARLEEIQNEMRHVALKLPMIGGPGQDYDEVYPPRLQDSLQSDRILSRAPIPPARQDLHDPPKPRRVGESPGERGGERGWERPGDRPGERGVGERGVGERGVDRTERFLEARGEAVEEPGLEDRPPPSPHARPVRRTEPSVRPIRAEPRLDWRR